MTRQLDYTTLPALWRGCDETQPALAFHARSLEEWQAWRAQLTRRLAELLGGFPADRPAPAAELLECEETPDYRLEKVAIETDPGLYMPCYVLTPRNVRPPYRPVIALHGHGFGGAAHLVGRVMDPANRAAEEAHIRAFNYDYAAQLARHGFMVFAPEQRGFGERLERWPGAITIAENNPVWTSSCRALAFNAMLMGKTLAGLRVWDVMRTIDYMRMRPERMVAGIGCLGLSGGGMTTLYAAALEPRITVAVPSGYFNTFRAAIMPVIHCECNYVPGIRVYAEMSDIAGLIAPRPLLVESGVEDPLFPVAATEAACAQAARVYALLGVPERIDSDIFPGGHRFSGAKAFAWLDRWL